MIANETYDKLKESTTLLRRFLAAPRTIGSVAPSSPALTESMLENVNWDKVKTVVELGAGTGVFTKAIIERAASETHIFIFEIDDELRDKLEKETGRTIYSNASNMREALTNEGIGKIDLIVSSIPYTVLPQKTTESIMQALQGCIEEDGTFVAFQYSLQMKKTFQQIFTDVKTRFVALNIPPAFVYECKGLKGR